MQPIFNGAGDVIGYRFRRPSDFHGHGRSGTLMRAIMAQLMFRLKYLLLMPNTGPITTLDELLAYREPFMDFIRQQSGYEGLEIIWTLYFTDKLTPEVIERIARLGIKVAIKYYPPHPGATTGSGHGIPLEAGHDILCAMQANSIRLLLHPESVYDKHDRELPHKEREAYFVDNHLYHLRDAYPNLLMSCEHGSTAAMVRFTKQDTSGKTFMTVTPQALLCTDEDLIVRTWGCHLKCMPIPKGWRDVEALREFVYSGDSRVGAGSDNAPHLSKTKGGAPADGLSHEEREIALAKAASGCWSPHSMALYARGFKDAGALDDRYERVVSLNGPAWWGFRPPAEDDLVTLRMENERDIPDPVLVPETNDIVIPLGWTNGSDAFHPGFILE